VVELVGCSDIGGSTLRVALADRAGNLLGKKLYPHAQSDAHSAIVKITIELQALACEHQAELCGVGVSAPGPLDPTTGIIAFSPNLGWREVPFAAELHARLPVPIAMDDDANCAALAEQWLGAGQNAREFIHVIVGTGIGAGLILNGRLYHGARGSAGELGHMTILAGGPECRCGNHGCLEALAAGPAIVRHARDMMARGRTSMLRQDTFTAREVIAAARVGDAVGVESIETAGRYLGIGLANAVNLFNPEVIVLGGGVAVDAGELLLMPARRELERRAFPSAADTVRLVQAKLGDEAGLIGAARMIWSELDRQKE
jgi:glucokinase